MVEEHEKLYTERERRNATLARQAQMRLGYLSTADIWLGIVVNQTAKNKDVPEIVRADRTFKARASAVEHFALQADK